MKRMLVLKVLAGISGIALCALVSCETLRRFPMESPKQPVKMSRFSLRWTVCPEITQDQDFLEFTKRMEYSRVTLDNERHWLYYATSEGKLKIVDLDGGAVLREVALQSPFYGRIALSGGYLYLGDVGGNVYKMDRDANRVLWRTNLQAEVFSRPVLDRDRVFVTTAYGEVFCLNESDGAIVWKQASRQKTDILSQIGVASPVVVDDVVYVGFDDGMLIAFKRDTGNLVWQERLSRAFGDAIWDLDFVEVGDSSAATGGLQKSRRLYAAAIQGGVYCIDLKSRKTLWHRTIDSRAPFIVGEVEESLYIVDQTATVYRLSLDDGRTLFQTAMPSGPPAKIALVGGVLLVTTYSSDGTAYLLDSRSGQILESRDLNYTIYGDVTVSSNYVYWVTSKGYLKSYVIQ